MNGKVIFIERNRAINGAVELDLDSRFAVWKLDIPQVVAIRPPEVSELLDGVIVY